jgi:hypothetical protein
MNLELVPSPEKTGGTIVIVKNLQAKHKNER